MSTLRISEIFYSLQGESTFVGIPTVFIRLTGCPLRCGYCDSEYAFKGGSIMSMTEILQKANCYNTTHVTVTGGEPLAQPDCIQLLRDLCDQGLTVSLETSGALDVSDVDSRVIKVMDLKTPGSGEVERNLYSNIDYLNSDDQIKFVICNEADYLWTKKQLTEYDLLNKCQILFSPSHGEVPNKALAEWILNDRLPVRFQIQLHKYIWGDIPGH